jgi:hypothetical protein
MMAGGPIVFYSRKESIVAQSTAEAELIAAWAGCREVVWVRLILSELGCEQPGATTLYEDNSACIEWAKRRGRHEAKKHVDVKYFFVTECVDNATVVLEPISTHEQLADLFTKGLAKNVFRYLQNKLELQIRLG